MPGKPGFLFQDKTMAKYYTINVEMFLGMKHYPGMTRKVFDPINGLTEMPVTVVRHGSGALGGYQPQDIGKRVYGSSVESSEQHQRRTGKTRDELYLEGCQAIWDAREKYQGEPTWVGLHVWKNTKPRPTRLNVILRNGQSEKIAA